jgi:hypothetical protein
VRDTFIPGVRTIYIISLPSVGRGSQGAWQKFERGEIPLFEFYETFGRELSDTTSGNMWYGAFLDYSTRSRRSYQVQGVLWPKGYWCVTLVIIHVFIQRIYDRLPSITAEPRHRRKTREALQSMRSRVLKKQSCLGQ